jgi:hypothetical protein
MCEDHALPRRRFLTGTAGAAAGALLLPRHLPPGLHQRLPLHSPARPISHGGTKAYSMAMHIHTSASEQSGSVDSHLYQATTHSVDVCWFTDHDGRMDARDYRTLVHFTSLTHEKAPPHEGGPWVWEKRENGPLNTSKSGGGIVTNPFSPHDPVAGGSLHLAAKSTSTSPATFGYYANCKPGGWNYRDNLVGQSLVIDILLDQGWKHGYLEMLIGTSYHQASAGRPAGIPQISYRFVRGAGSRSHSTQGNLGIVHVPVDNSSGWATVTVEPSRDIAKLWPTLDYRDFALFSLTLNAVSTGDRASGYFDYLRFDRTKTGGEVFAQQQSIGADLAATYPAVTQQWGLEVSSGKVHFNWFGPGVFVPTYAGVPKNESAYIKYVTTKVLPKIHQAGALYSYNHPYGAQGGPLLPTAQQDTLLKQTAATLLPTRALGADLLEVGYRVRGHCDIDHHVGLWDVMSRNAVFLTGNGVTDDHFGQDYLAPVGSPRNNWVTRTWATSTKMSHLQAALAAGRAWCGDLAAFGSPHSALDMLVDKSVPMGAVSVARGVNSRKLALTVLGIPAGGSVTLLQGAVDYAGKADPVPHTRPIRHWTDTQIARQSGTVHTSVDTSADSFVRATVQDSHGKLVGVGNPIWLLQKTPPSGIPAPRQT